ncbi:RnfH family protein [Marichromatium bheemlicum]|nr:RnfH family protein [Marichromatium bheemlicum]
MAEKNSMRIGVAYASKEQRAWLRIEVPEETTVGEAIARSGMLERFPEIDLKVNRVGIFGRLVTLERTLAPEERVEIYRPIDADPETIERRDRD